MALSPALTAALLGGLSEVPQALGTLMPTALDRSNRERRRALERRAELNLLGLSEDEMAVQRDAVTREVEASERALADRRQRAMAGAGMGSGEALKVALEAEQAQLAQRSQLAQELQRQDVAEQAAELDELDQLIAEQARRQNERRAAIAAPVKQGADSLTDFLDFTRTSGQTKEKVDDSNVDYLMSNFGLSRADAKAAADAMANPDLELLD